MKLGLLLVVTMGAFASLPAVASKDEGGETTCLPGERSGAACQLSRSLSRNGVVVLTFDSPETEGAEKTLKNASRKTLDTTTPVRVAEKKPALDFSADEWCKNANR